MIANAYTTGYQSKHPCAICGIEQRTRAALELHWGPCFDAHQPKAGFGAIPDLTGDMTTDEYIRSIRE